MSLRQWQEVQELPRLLTDSSASGIRVLIAIGTANALVAFVHFGLAAAGPQLRSLLQLTNSELGWLLAAAPAGLMLGTFAWGVLADAIGERRALTIAYLATAAALLAAAQVATAAQVPAFGALLLASGAAGSAAHSAGGRAIVEAFPAHLHGRMLAIRHTFIPVGGALGGVALPALLDGVGLATTIVIMACWALVTAVLLGSVVPSGRAHRQARREQRQAVRAAAQPRSASASPLRSTQLWLLAGSCSMLALTQLSLVSFLTIYLVDESLLQAATAGVLFAVAQLIGAGGRITMGSLADRINDPFRVLQLITTSVLVLVGAALLAPTLHLHTLVPGMLLTIALLVATTWNGVAVAAAARLAPPERMGATLGMQTTTFATMGVIAPIAVGAALTGAGWGPVLGVGVAVLVLAIIGMTRLRARVAG